MKRSKIENYLEQKSEIDDDSDDYEILDNDFLTSLNKQNEISSNITNLDKKNLENIKNF